MEFGMSSCTLYIDPTGDSGWFPPFGKSRTRWYVVAGLVLTPDTDFKARQGTETILKKYISDSMRNQYPDKYYEIHYRDIIGGNNIYSQLSHEQRKDLSDEVFDLLTNIHPVLFATAIDKLQLKYKYGGRAYHPRQLGLRATIHRYSMYLDREGLVGSVIIDEEEYRKDVELRTMIHNFRRYGITLRGWNYQPAKENRLERVLNTVGFTPSEMSSGIQLVDVCSRATWAHFALEKSRRFDQLSAFWDRHESRTYEPVVFPS